MVENAKLRNDIEELKKQLLEKERQRGGTPGEIPTAAPARVCLPFDVDVVAVLLPWWQSVLTISDVILALLLSLRCNQICLSLMRRNRDASIQFSRGRRRRLSSLLGPTRGDVQDKHVRTLTRIWWFSDFGWRNARRLEELTSDGFEKARVLLLGNHGVPMHCGLTWWFFLIAIFNWSTDKTETVCQKYQPTLLIYLWDVEKIVKLRSFHCLNGNSEQNSYFLLILCYCF